MFGEHLHEPLMLPIFDNGLLEELQENLRAISGMGCRVFRSANKSEGYCFLQHVLEFLNSIWVNYNDLTATSLGIMVSRGDYPQMALFQVSELL